ncbi:hypothetical protein THAOC_17998 [Thalassiosira oceanica]|uniref:Arrestin-like N-terminal domain-containing protein n=1 Tax=Thalassiosira oceanica TaxID=159749 RepID=K0ST77_THAOC|nr:hypothetical protein THAOC_17998 [Thalassiosira oceanica]|eukprot:EJK61502.1 hypothetical protein THAOC_17998 [Thalassiosira oceanica]
MGNQSSSSGRLEIVLDPPPHHGAFIAGSTLSGSVFAEAPDQISSQIKLVGHVHGREKSKVQYTTSNGDSTTTHHARAERQLLRIDVDFGTRDGVEAGGRYRFPFQVSLPPDLPSSMYRAGEGSAYAKVHYMITVAPSGWGGGIQQKEFKVVSAPMPADPVPHMTEPISTYITRMCCLDAGLVIMGAKVANTRLGVGESGVIDFAAKNQSTRGIKSAEVRVKEYVYWKAGGRDNRNERVVSYSVFKPTARWKEMDKDQFKVHQSRSKKRTDSFRNEQNALYQTIHKAINDAENRTFFKINFKCVAVV